MGSWLTEFEQKSLAQRRIMAKQLAKRVREYVKGFDTVLAGRLRKFTKNEGAIEDLIVEIAFAFATDKATLREFVESAVPIVVAQHEPGCDCAPPEWARRAVERIAAKAYA
jgi:hypothetical protein